VCSPLASLPRAWTPQTGAGSVGPWSRGVTPDAKYRSEANETAWAEFRLRGGGPDSNARRSMKKKRRETTAVSKTRAQSLSPNFMNRERRPTTESNTSLPHRSILLRPLATPPLFNHKQAREKEVKRYNEPLARNTMHALPSRETIEQDEKEAFRHLISSAKRNGERMYSAHLDERHHVSRPYSRSRTHELVISKPAMRRRQMCQLISYRNE